MLPLGCSRRIKDCLSTNNNGKDTHSVPACLLDKLSHITHDAHANVCHATYGLEVRHMVVTQLIMMPLIYIPPVYLLLCRRGTRIIDIPTLLAYCCIANLIQAFAYDTQKDHNLFEY
jgi:hypothetical protein